MMDDYPKILVSAEALFSALGELERLDPQAVEKECFAKLEEAAKQLKGQPIPAPVPDSGEKPKTRYRFREAPGVVLGPGTMPEND